MAGMYIYQQMSGHQESIEGSAHGGGVNHQGYHLLEVEGIPAEKVRILFKGAPKGLVDEEEISDEPYWADLPTRQRYAFYLRDEVTENKREWGSIWRTFVADPLQPARDYTTAYGLTGIGLFLEGYVIFSISQNTILFQHTYYDCWKGFTTCNVTWTQATTYLQLVGILIGQLTFGFLGDALGRRFIALVDMWIILLGVVMLTLANGTTIQGWLIMYAIAQFVFGLGIGGEYPQTSTRATEESTVDRINGQRHRGRKVMLAYTMQGWGQFVNLGVLILLMLIFNSTGNPPLKTKTNPHQDYSNAAMGAVWRTSFGLLIPVVLYVMYHRIYQRKELQQLNQFKNATGVKGYDWRSFGLLMSHYWHRLVGTAGCWACNNWYFYGNGVFRSTFVSILLGSKASIMNNWLWSFLNAGVQLFGYYFAALSVDIKPWGRRRMTTLSFLAVAVLFLAAYIQYNDLVAHHIHAFQAIYYLSSFFGLFGSHTTSFLLAAECFPAVVRSTTHGISAASGKVASITVVVWFNYVSTRTKFLIVFPGSFLGAVICWVFIPDLTGLDLAEGERRWTFIRAGRAKDYHGPAVNPRHLSLWEKWVLGIHKQYNPVLDREQKRQARAAGIDNLHFTSLLDSGNFKETEVDSSLIEKGAVNGHSNGVGNGHGNGIAANGKGYTGQA